MNKNKESSNVDRIEEGLQKLMKFCAYRERCEHEVRNKLKRLGFNADESAIIIAELESQQFVNEERFARLFVKSKFNSRAWGKLKIQNELFKKFIPQSVIDVALEEIEEDLYLKKLEKILRQKFKSLAHIDIQTKKKRTIAYAIQKGYEAHLVYELMAGVEE